MAYRVRPCRSLDELGQAAGAIGHYFGWVPSEEEVERFSQALPVERMHAAFDGKEIVGGAGVFPFEMTVPGGPVQCAGVTVVGVLPTHRRRGLLSRMMRAQIDDVHERGEPFAVLWASEATIYGRFGYGLASMTYEIRLPRTWAALRAGNPGSHRRDAARRSRRGAEGLPSSVRPREAGDTGLPLAKQGVVGEPEAAGRPVAAPPGCRPAQPRAARARRTPGRVCPVSPRPVRGGRSLEAQAPGRRGARSRTGGNP